MIVNSTANCHSNLEWKPSGRAVRLIDALRGIVSITTWATLCVMDIIASFEQRASNATASKSVCTFFKAPWPLTFLETKIAIIEVMAAFCWFLILLIFFLQKPIGKPMLGYANAHNRRMALLYSLIGFLCWFCLAMIPGSFFLYVRENSTGGTGGIGIHLIESCCLILLYHIVANLPIIVLGLLCLAWGRTTSFPPLR